jgi:hypothetical protein
MISQLYINQLAEREGKNDLNELIGKVLCQRESFKSELDLIRNKISENNVNISTKLSELFLYRSYNTLKKNPLKLVLKLI